VGKVAIIGGKDKRPSTTRIEKREGGMAMRRTPMTGLTHISVRKKCAKVLFPYLKEGGKTMLRCVHDVVRRSEERNCYLELQERKEEDASK